VKLGPAPVSGEPNPGERIKHLVQLKTYCMWLVHMIYMRFHMRMYKYLVLLKTYCMWLVHMIYMHLHMCMYTTVPFPRREESSSKSGRASGLICIG